LILKNVKGLLCLNYFFNKAINLGHIPYDILRKLYAQKPLHMAIVVYNKRILMIGSLIVNQKSEYFQTESLIQ